MTIKELQNKIKNISSAIERGVQTSLQDAGSEAVDRNVAQMEKHGQNSRGGSLKNPRTGDTKYASPEYAEYKSMLGRESRFINLNLTGDFHRSMDFKVTKGGIDIFATDDKTDRLIKAYGMQIFGLNDENFDWLFDEVFEGLFTELKSYLS